MGREASKAMRRRFQNSFWQSVFVGNGIDVGAGPDCIDQHRDKFPKMGDIRNWDIKDGDAQFLATIEDESLDFVHSSHCLEHLRDPLEAIKNWARVLKPGGHIIVTVPEWEMYEKKNWPSKYNGDHKTAWTMDIYETGKHIIYVPDFLFAAEDYYNLERVKLEKIDAGWNPDDLSDQTRPHDGPECAIEFILKKKLT